jgi:hypothetical protein
MALLFDEAPHEYFLDGVETPSMTQHPARRRDRVFRRRPAVHPRASAPARARAVHALCHF